MGSRLPTDCTNHGWYRNSCCAASALLNGAKDRRPSEFPPRPEVAPTPTCLMASREPPESRQRRTHRTRLAAHPRPGRRGIGIGWSVEEV